MVAHVGWYMPYGLAVVSALLGVWVIRALPESRPMPDDATPSFGQMAENLRRALRHVRQLPGLVLWVILGAGLATMVTINNLYAQSTLVLKSASLEQASLLVAAAGLTTAVGSWAGGRILSQWNIRVLSFGTLVLGIAVATVGLLPLVGGRLNGGPEIRLMKVPQEKIGAHSPAQFPKHLIEFVLATVAAQFGAL